MFRIRFQLNPDPDPAKYLNPDPDPEDLESLNPDPDPSYFLALSESKNLKLLHNYKIFSSKEVN